jgi:hypothetical protein
VVLRFTLKVCEDAIHDDFGSLASAAFDVFCDKGMSNTLWNPRVYNLFFRQQVLQPKRARSSDSFPLPKPYQMKMYRSFKMAISRSRHEKH